MYQPSGSPRVDRVARAPSLQFPPGTGYGAALRSLFAAVVARGELPREARLAPPLPAGVVVRTSPGAGVRVDLTAPWGYVVPTGAVRTPALTFPGTTPRAEVRRIIRGLRSGRIAAGPLPPGVRVEVPRLPACQVQRGIVPVAPCRLAVPERPD